MNVELLIKSIIKYKYQIGFVFTGGGTSFLSKLLSIPGASDFFIEAQIPYNKKSLELYVGNNLESTCNAVTAVNMANISYQHIYNTIGKEKLILGISCTAALKTIRERKGSQRAHVAIYSKNSIFYRYLQFDNNNNREEQESILCDQIINYIYYCVNSL